MHHLRGIAPLFLAAGIVMAVFTFLAIPVGTIISILTIWIFREELDNMLGRGQPSNPLEVRRSP